MADAADAARQADLARLRADAAAQSKVLALAAQKKAEEALASVGAIHELVSAKLQAISTLHAAAAAARAQAQSAAADARETLTTIGVLVDSIAADGVAFDDSQAQLGATTVAAAIEILALRLVAGPPADGPELDFTNPENAIWIR